MFWIFIRMVSLASLSEWVSVKMHPFFLEYGYWFLDGHGPYWVSKRLPNGALLQLDISEKTQRNIYIGNPYERSATRFLLKILRSGDVFVDVGANIGYFSALAHQAGATVIAYEPEEKNFEQLKKLPINARRVCVGSHEGSAVLYVNPRNRGGNSIIPFAEYRSGGHVVEVAAPITQEVPLIRLEAAEARVVKIDVEGAEYDVLHGMIGTPPYVLCEMTQKREESIDLMKARGYGVFYADQDGSLHEGAEGRDLVFVKENQDQ